MKLQLKIIENGTVSELTTQQGEKIEGFLGCTGMRIDETGVSVVSIELIVENAHLVLGDGLFSRENKA